MEYIRLVLANTSLWEIMALIVVLYLLFNPALLRTVTRLKIGELEIELNALKQKVAQGEQQIKELETEIEGERRLFNEILSRFDANAPLKDLASVRQTIKGNAKNLDEIDDLKAYLTPEASPEELFAAAVSVRERRPTALLPDLIELLSALAKKPDLGGYRLNTIWTLTSALHLTLLSAIRDGVHPAPSLTTLRKALVTLDLLEQHPRVQGDRPDNPMKGIRGPIKHSLAWIEKGLANPGSAT